MSRKHLTFVLFLLCNTQVLLSQKKTVNIKFTYLEPYCGGARPTPEMQAEAQKPRPYAKRTVIVVSSAGKTDSLKTNGGGQIKLRLKPGTYKVFEAWRYYKSTPGGTSIGDFDTECLKAEWEKETYLIEIKSKACNVKEVNQIINYCNWSKPCLKDDKRQVPE